MWRLETVNKENYKTFTHLFELTKQKSQKNYYHNLLITYENDMKRTLAGTILEQFGHHFIDFGHMQLGCPN